jgi:hypothetical protein
MICNMLFDWCFVIDLLMHHKFEELHMINKRWRNMTNEPYDIHMPCMFFIVSKTTINVRPVCTWSQLLGSKSLRWIRVVSNLASMEVGTYHFLWSPKSQVPSMTWMPTWHHFWRQDLGLVLRVGSSKRLNPTPNISPNIYLHKIIKIRL